MAGLLSAYGVTAAWYGFGVGGVLLTVGWTGWAIFGFVALQRDTTYAVPEDGVLSVDNDGLVSGGNLRLHIASGLLFGDNGTAYQLLAPRKLHEVSPDAVVHYLVEGGWHDLAREMCGPVVTRLLVPAAA